MKRVFTFMLAVCLILCLCACQKDTEDHTDTPTTNSTDSTNVPSPSQPTESETDPTPTELETDPAPATVSVPRILTLTTTRYTAGSVSSENVSEFTYDGDIANLDTYSGDFLSAKNSYNYKTNTIITAASFSKDGKATYSEYDSYGTQISTKRYTNDVLTESTTTHATYVDGKLTERKTFYDNGRLMSHFTYEYDSNGNPTAYIEYSVYKEGVESGRDTFIYDDQGKKIEQISVSYSIDVTLHYYFTYDANGNEIEKVCYNNDVESSRWKTTYDAQERILEVTYYSKGELISRGTHLYDEQGYRIGYESHNANGDLVFKSTITYELIEVSQEDAENAILFYESMSKRT